ncbi:zinc-dependent alcohol dehydrogenase family protein [Limosilactobacillus fermentum]|uniref:zinc-dependent alcohol dehydrogenase family protein n=1 Tax=Limosilactobacillus fermentum TaxID=1613 RepID=UPI0022E23FCD|nr:zinc-dependent alcohol dehydrogenase family protein [Limosilactobacillus fermentum]
MKALVMTDVKKLEVQDDYPTPTIQPNEVLIHTAWAGICGTDKALYNGLPGSADAVPPIVLGHENSGVVAEVGQDVVGFKVGDRVSVDPNIYCHKCFFCRTSRPELCEHLDAVGVTRDGGFAEYFTAPEEVVYHVPDNVSLEAAAVIEPISCAEHGVDLLDTHPEEVQADSYDIVVEAVGLPQTQEQAVEAARRGGQVLIFGVGNPSSTFNVNTYKVYQRQLTIQGSFINPYTFEDSVALLQSGDVDPLPLISNVLDFAHVEDFVSGKLGNISKAIVKVAGEEA